MSENDKKIFWAGLAATLVETIIVYALSLTTLPSGPAIVLGGLVSVVVQVALFLVIKITEFSLTMLVTIAVVLFVINLTIFLMYIFSKPKIVIAYAQKLS